MQLVGATKTTTARERGGTRKNTRLQGLLWKDPLTALGSSRGEGVPAVVESDIYDMEVSAGQRRLLPRTKPTQRSATVHIILEFGCVEEMVRRGGV